MKQLRYYFNYIETCNFCDSTVEKSKILGQRLNQSQGFNPKNKIGISTSVMKCKNCGLIFSNPQPVPFDIQDHYGLPPESYWKPEYFAIDKNYFGHQIKTTKKLLPFEKGMKALDVGAGLGKCMLSLEAAGYDVYGFEPSVPFHQKAIGQMNILPDRLKLGMIEEVDYPENNFDFITFGAVLEHLYDPAAAIKRAMKWLKPGGLIHIEVPSSKYLMAKIFNFYFRLRGTNYVNNISPMHRPFHLYEFSIESFRYHASTENYEIAHHEYYVCDVYFIPKIFHPVLKWYMASTNTGMQLAVWLRKK
jgi:2-polyprenyl-3-methyl-5-hydroxy-6-metoxy-1,4-benzoquinol methylase